MNIEHTDKIMYTFIEGVQITQRKKDEYLNATEICQLSGKKLNNYLRQDKIKEYLEVLEAKTHISVIGLVQKNKGGKASKDQSTWVHPMVFIDLLAWISPQFKAEVYEFYLEGKLWFGARNGGKTTRLAFTDTLKIAGFEGKDYGILTNKMYQLLGITKGRNDKDKNMLHNIDLLEDFTKSLNEKRVTVNKVEIVNNMHEAHEILKTLGKYK